MYNLKNKTSIITGASKGLGHDLAISLSKDNNKLFLVSRDLNKLNKLKRKCYFSSKHKVFSSNLIFNSSVSSLTISSNTISASSTSTSVSSSS